jgi:hypothetical protein
MGKILSALKQVAFTGFTPTMKVFGRKYYEIDKDAQEFLLEESGELPPSIRREANRIKENSPIFRDAHVPAKKKLNVPSGKMLWIIPITLRYWQYLLVENEELVGWLELGDYGILCKEQLFGKVRYQGNKAAIRSIFAQWWDYYYHIQPEEAFIDTLFDSQSCTAEEIHEGALPLPICTDTIFELKMIEGELIHYREVPLSKEWQFPNFNEIMDRIRKQYN